MVRAGPLRLVILAIGLFALATPGVADAAGGGADDILDNLGETPPPTKTTTDGQKKEPEKIDAIKPGAEAAKPAEGAAAAASSKPATTAGLESAPASLDRIKAVPRKAILKRRRFELSPYVSASLNDSYYQHFAAGGSLIYYLHDSFAVGLGGDYLWANIATDNLQAVRQNFIAVPASFDHPTVFAHLDAYFVPLYGKLSLFESDIIHFDFYAAAGGGVAFVPGRTRPEVNVGLGQRFVFGDWLALRLEVRDHAFLDNQEVQGVQRSDIQNFVMFQAGMSLFIPPSFDYGGL